MQKETERSKMERQNHEVGELLNLLDPTSPEFKEIMVDVVIQLRQTVKWFTDGRQIYTETHNEQEGNGGIGDVEE